MLIFKDCAISIEKHPSLAYILQSFSMEPLYITSETLCTTNENLFESVVVKIQYKSVYLEGYLVHFKS